MKKLIAGLILAILITGTAQAGKAPVIEDVEVTFNITTGPRGDLSLTRVEGTMAAVRFTEDDVQEIGCRIAATRFEAASVVCLARDINAVLYGCISFDPAIIEAAKSISSYSYIRFEFGRVELGNPPSDQCEYLLVATRSSHIPDADTAKSKAKAK